MPSAGVEDNIHSACRRLMQTGRGVFIQFFEKGILYHGFLAGTMGQDIRQLGGWQSEAVCEYLRNRASRCKAVQGVWTHFYEVAISILMIMIYINIFNVSLQWHMFMNTQTCVQSPHMYMGDLDTYR